jgi:hypothetical protein
MKTQITPLINASIRGTEKEIKEIITAGADIDERDEIGMTALMWAAKKTKYPEKISVLLDLGADPLLQSNSGKNALYYAYRNPRLRHDIFNKLREATKPNIENESKNRLSENKYKILKNSIFFSSLCINIAIIVGAFVLIPSDLIYFPIAIGFVLIINPVGYIIYCLYNKEYHLENRFLEGSWGMVVFQTMLMLFLGLCFFVNIFYTQ